MGSPFANRVMFGLFKPTKILTLDRDRAGTVEAVGKKVTKFKTGDDVFGDLSTGNWGSFANFTCAREDELIIKPSCMPFIDVAAIPQAGLLALQGLRDKKEIKDGISILINGAGGGMGTFCIQIAKYLGAEVTGVDTTAIQVPVT